MNADPGIWLRFGCFLDTTLGPSLVKEPLLQIVQEGRRRVQESLAGSDTRLWGREE